MRARFWYKITNGSSTIAFPFANQMPWLDQTVANMLYYYAIDPFESRYLMLFGTWVKAITKIGAPILKAFAKSPFVTNEEYLALRHALNMALSVSRSL